MLRQISYMCYGFKYVFKTKILRMDIPAIGGLVINDKCNLSCKQCRVGNYQGSNLSYNDVINGLKTFYNKGIRSVFIEGGEPFLWEYDGFGLEQVIDKAREIGFKTVSIYTNGTFELKTSADVVFVSLDGLKQTNNKLRGQTFDKVIENIKNSKHENININFTINSLNKDEIGAFCEYVSKVEKINGIFFYFHTPYYGYDDLYLDLGERRIVIKQIFKLKKKGYNILNSSACLKMVYKDNWKRPSKLCYVYDKNKIYECCRAIGKEDVCKNCGYLGYPEIISIIKLKPSALRAAVNYLPKGRKKHDR